MHTHVPISPLSWASLPSSLSHPSRSPQSTKLISLCYGCCFPLANCFIFSSVYLSMLLSLCPIFPLPPHVLKSILYVYIFIPALQRGSSVPFFFFRFHIYALAYGICFSLSDLLHSVWQTLGPSTSLQITQFRFFLWLIFHCIYVPRLLYPFICRWTFRLVPCPGYCK